MASLSIMKNTIWRSVSKAANSPQLPSLYPRKVSRVCFTSASKFHKNQYAREDSGGEEDTKAAERMREARQVYENDQEAEEVERKYQGMKQQAKETAQGMRDKAKEGTQQASEAMEDLKETTKDKTNMASEKMYEAKDKVKAGVEKAGDTMHDAKERTKETVQNVGKKAKETTKGAWESAKDATKKIKDTVVGDDGNKVRPEDYMEDRLPKRPGEARDQKADRGFP